MTRDTDSNEVRDLLAGFREVTGIERCGIELQEDGWAFRFGKNALNRSWSGFTWDELLTTLRKAVAEGKRVPVATSKHHGQEPAND